MSAFGGISGRPIREASFPLMTHLCPRRKVFAVRHNAALVVGFIFDEHVCVRQRKFIGFLGSSAVHGRSPHAQQSERARGIDFLHY